FLSTLTPPPPHSTLFPYTTLFRSAHIEEVSRDCVISLDEEDDFAAAGQIAFVKASLAFLGECRNCQRDQKREQLNSSCNYCFHRSEEHTSELQSPCNLVCRLLLEK